MSPGDVALLDTLDGWTVHVPGHPDEADCCCGIGRRRRRPGLLRLSAQTMPNRSLAVAGRGSGTVRAGRRGP